MHVFQIRYKNQDCPAGTQYAMEFRQNARHLMAVDVFKAVTGINHVEFTDIADIRDAAYNVWIAAGVYVHSRFAVPLKPARQGIAATARMKDVTRRQRSRRVHIGYAEPFHRFSAARVSMISMIAAFTSDVIAVDDAVPTSDVACAAADR